MRTGPLVYVRGVIVQTQKMLMVTQLLATSLRDEIQIQKKIIYNVFDKELYLPCNIHL